MLEKLESLNINVYQIALFALLVAVVSGVLPLANELDLNLVVIALVGLIATVKVVDDVSAVKIIVHELAKVEFADKRLNELLDKADMIVNAMGSQEPARLHVSIPVDGVAVADTSAG